MARRVGNQPGNPELDRNAAEREALAFRLRAQGYDFATIAYQCGYANPSGAYKAYRRALASIPKHTVEEMRQNILAQQLMALVAMGKRIEHGDHLAIREMTGIHDRMAKLFGLDAVRDEQLVAGPAQVKMIRQGARTDAAAN